ncbi:MAG: hypothetical protein WAZ48_11655 [Lysobacteraceae bacterium]
MAEMSHAAPALSRAKAMMVKLREINSASARVLHAFEGLLDPSLDGPAWMDLSGAPGSSSGSASALLSRNAFIAVIRRDETCR